ncbi:glycosyltransferase family 2 protein [Vibrio gigantis]|uniref:glycosyltransferase family 2 protein n=1 Tax=Vibrio gigantis TaxID=296199 RepID=UPI001302CFFB|nr:glycosyltransferase family 2 protein [Vibrio gigantis]
MKNKKIDILIPTYNRSSYVKKNIATIVDILDKTNTHDRVNVYISNDCSSDDTSIVLNGYMNNSNVTIINHKNNIGVQSNLLFLIEKSNSEYVMYLGDDDYISLDYITSVISAIDNVNDLSAIVPSFRNIDIEGNYISGGRDLGMSRSIHSKGFSSSKYFARRAHQMSGIVLKREGVFESFRAHGINNFYPHVFMVLRSTLIGTVLHETNYPVLVTQPGQDKKGWSYGDDGLLDDYFNNFKLFSNIERFVLEQNFLNYNRWRYITALRTSPIKFMKSVVSSKNTTKLTKLSYFFLVLKALVFRIFRR